MDSQSPQRGELIAGRFRVEKVLGAGGMGVVVAARHVELGELVAVKMLRVDVEDPRAFERMRREARAAAKLRGEHVVRVTDVGTLESGAPFIVMEHVVGKTLAQAREAVGKLPPSTAVDWVLQACEGLAEAHGLGIVHRDIKPSNLLLTARPDGSRLIKLLDFGIAKSSALSVSTLTDTGGFVGSPLYASPEQARGARDVDHRTDIWSMGVVLYQLVTGQLPFPSFTATAAVASLMLDPPVAPRSVAPELSPELEQVLLRCLEKEPARRYATVAELARALEPFGSDEAAGATERVTRILNQAGRQASESAPLEESQSTLAAFEDDQLAASRTASHVLRQTPGRLSAPARTSPWWLLAVAALVLLGVGVWVRSSQREAALTEPPRAAVAQPLSSPSVTALAPPPGAVVSTAPPPVVVSAAPPATVPARRPALAKVRPTPSVVALPVVDDFGPRE